MPVPRLPALDLAQQTHYLGLVAAHRCNQVLGSACSSPALVRVLEVQIVPASTAHRLRADLAACSWADCSTLEHLQAVLQLSLRTVGCGLVYAKEAIKLLTTIYGLEKNNKNEKSRRAFGLQRIAIVLHSDVWFYK